MKANELRIGNYVTLNNDVKIVNGNLIKEQQQSEMIIREIYLEPIQLTEEWLLKFGFAWRGLNEKFLTKYTPCGKAVVNSKNGFFKLAGVTIEVEIKFVHQLQNLYFALTGEELTFKSE